MQRVSIQHVVFDCDGVLVDSEHLSALAEVELLASFGVTADAHALTHRFIGQTTVQMWRALQAEHGLALPDNFRDWYEGRMTGIYHASLQAVPGIREALAGLPVPASCASNSSRRMLREKLAITGLAPHFGARVYAADDVTEPKPAPDLYLLAAARAGVDPAACVVVEDSVAGTRSGLAAGMTVLGFTGVHFDPAGAAADLRAAGVAAVFDDMTQLSGLLRELDAAAAGA
jgi:HAD superfamily hydrolase (TIGR01509 family)